ncbi:MAG: crosslink repair DNA glycosylase YcaQ family protein [Hyphomicrobiaceae bacterium]
MNQLPSQENLTVEFKSDRNGLSDSDIVLAAVCLANSAGGRLFIGIEDDGTVTGASAPRQSPHRLAALIANSTSPALSVRVEVHDVGALRVSEIIVQPVDQLVGTRDGRFQRRVLRADGQPECIGMQPHDLAGRMSEIGQTDFTAQAMPTLGLDCFDPVERERLKRLIREYHGDQTLLGLTAADFDAALGFTVQQGQRAIPTLAGLLMLGRSDVLVERVPTHEVAFQVLRGTSVVLNEFYRLPLGRIFEQMMDHLKVLVTEQEVMVGILRVAVPSIDRRTFREAVVNAMTHRDYARLGQITVQLKDDELAVASPGGFVRGITLDNLLRMPPTPRNPRLADIFKRLGLSERTGRGVDIIFEGTVRFGRMAPSYRRSTSELVVVNIDARPADLAFVRAIVDEEQRRGQALPLDALIILARLKIVKRATTAELAEAIQEKDIDATRAAVERLVEAGLVQAHGTGKGRSYTMSAKLYRQLGQSAEHIRQTGFDAEQQRQMVLKYVREHGSIKRADVVRLCSLSEDQAKRLLRALAEEGLVVQSGAGRGSKYERPI